QLVLGSLEEIRAVATAARNHDTRPDYHFAHDRQHWIYQDASDTGFPVNGGLRIKLGKRHAALIGPEQWWRAEDVRKLYIRAATSTHRRPVAVLWSTPERGFAADQRVELTIEPTGKMQSSEIHLARSATYRETITGLRLELGEADSSDDEMIIESISWK